MKNISTIKFIVANAIALLLGIGASGAMSLINPIASPYMLVAVFAPMLISFLYGFAGFVPAIVMAASMLTGGFIYGNIEWLVVLLIGAVLPAVVMIYSSYKGFRFFVQVRNAIIVQMLSLVTLLICASVLTGKDFSTMMIDSLRAGIDMMSQESKDLFAELMREFLQIGKDAEGLLTTEGLIDALLKDLETMFKIGVPSALIMYPFLNGAVGVLWMNWLRIRHGEENVQYVPLSGWRLSKEITLGLLIFYILMFIISGSIGERAASAAGMISSAVLCACYVQTGASLMSRMKAAGVSVAKRTTIYVLLILFGSGFGIIETYGMASALFGSKGLFKPKRIKNDHDNEQNDKNEEDL